MLLSVKVKRGFKTFLQLSVLLTGAALFVWWRLLHVFTLQYIKPTLANRKKTSHLIDDVIKQSELILNIQNFPNVGNVKFYSRYVQSGSPTSFLTR